MTKKKTSKVNENAEGIAKLELLQNFYVGDTLKMKGSIIELSEAQATERLANTDKIFRRI